MPSNDTTALEPWGLHQAIIEQAQDAVIIPERIRAAHDKGFHKAICSGTTRYNCCLMTCVYRANERAV